jgi:hypothetical protein
MRENNLFNSLLFALFEPQDALIAERHRSQTQTMRFAPLTNLLPADTPA